MENVALDRGILGHKHHEDVLFWCVDIRGPGLLVPKTECCAEKNVFGLDITAVFCKFWHWHSDMLEPTHV